MGSKKISPLRGRRNVAKSGNSLPWSGHFELDKPLENILGSDYLEKVVRFKSAFLEYIQNPEVAKSEAIIRLAREAGIDLWPEKRGKGDRSYYELLLKGPKNQFYYSQIADDLFKWGELSTAISLLDEGITKLKDKELVNKRDLFITYTTYIGGSSAELRSLILMAARTDIDITIEGETGTGKEVVANLLHGLSNRKKKPFVAFSCAEVPPSLAESELLGHEKGSFTGALQKTRGLIEMANGGTLFIDELTSLPNEIQAVLLRTLQERDVKTCR